MIMKNHRQEARAFGADTDPCELFAYSIYCERYDATKAKRYGASHGRYKKIRRSHRELVIELSRALDPNNSMGLR